MEYEITDVVPERLLWAIGGIEFSNICYIINGTESLQSGKLESGSYPEAVYKCKEALISYFEKSPDDEAVQIDKIWKLVTKKKKSRKNLQDEMLMNVAKMSMSLPARVFVYLTCEIKNLDFWDAWVKLHKKVYHDETVKQYAPDDIIAERTAAIEKPVKPVTTSNFLREDYPLMFWNTPEQIITFRMMTVCFGRMVLRK